MQNTTITKETVSSEVLDSAFEHNHSIELMPNEDLPDFLEGDPVRLKQIMINLVKNALKFTRRGLVRIIMAFDSVNEMLVVHVVDTGKGIKQEEMS